MFQMDKDSTLNLPGANKFQNFVNSVSLFLPGAAWLSLSLSLSLSPHFGLGADVPGQADFDSSYSYELHET